MEFPSMEILNVFITFEKLENRFLVQSTAMEKATLSYKTALSKANIKANRMGNGDTTWTYHKMRGLPKATLFFEKFKLSIITSYKQLI